MYKTNENYSQRILTFLIYGGNHFTIQKKNLKYYPLPAGKFLTVQLIGDKLAISSKDSKKLEDVKELLVSRGNYFLEERTKIGPHGDKIFTYLFLTKNV